MKITARKPYEDFDGYQGLLPQTPWPHEGGFMVSPYGFVPEVSLDHVVKDAGDYSMQFRYRTGAMPQAGVSRLYNPNLDWAGFDAVRFWLRPDGSGRLFTFFVLEKIRHGHKWFWEAPYKMTGDAPVIVTMPFSAFYRAVKNDAPDKAFDSSLIEETAWWVRQGGAASNPQVPSSVWIDSIEVVKLAQPLDHVVAEAAPPPAINNDKSTRIDYGGEADWVDAQGHLWQADVPSKHGVRFTLPTTPFPGTSNAQLYRTGRRGIDHLDFALPNGTYDFTLFLLEPDPKFNRAGKRVFVVQIEDTKSVPIDPFTKAKGTQRPTTITLRADVKDGTANVAFAAKISESVLCALQITPVTAATPR
ncbi:MAG: malectin domain-containing carbohydrate-binding protein [Deltaproteobacteria bacterium]|nr:malectin domain-containing carbohydrate-binding protein [Deltaproteobacteria bacterium]